MRVPSGGVSSRCRGFGVFGVFGVSLVDNLVGVTSDMLLVGVTPVSSWDVGV